MDLEDQWKLARVIEHGNHANLYVLIGCPDAESSQIQAETVSTGDPSLSGPLTGKQLRLKVMHIVEPEAAAFFSPQAFEKYILPFIHRFDKEAICQRMNDIRKKNM
ncbi:hypothetical protein [uncultured Desulfovibrio sp.]|uniref:hypothetical protein n=1 Tax=uncultured Desulfovibrio sp. TaxID=167968 RepID=UPI002804B88F|nr:hypothetical protein [uncultured Desulfovibrio sp.]